MTGGRPPSHNASPTLFRSHFTTEVQPSRLTTVSATWIGNAHARRIGIVGSKSDSYLTISTKTSVHAGRTKDSQRTQVTPYLPRFRALGQVSYTPGYLPKLLATSSTTTIEGHPPARPLIPKELTGVAASTKTSPLCQLLP